MKKEQHETTPSTPSLSSTCSTYLVKKLPIGRTSSHLLLLIKVSHLCLCITNQWPCGVSSLSSLTAAGICRLMTTGLSFPCSVTGTGCLWPGLSSHWSSPAWPPPHLICVVNQRQLTGNLINHLSLTSSRKPGRMEQGCLHVRIVVKVSQIAPKWDKSGIFSDQISVHFGAGLWVQFWHWSSGMEMVEHWLTSTERSDIEIIWEACSEQGPLRHGQTSVIWFVEFWGVTKTSKSGHDCMNGKSWAIISLFW